MNDTDERVEEQASIAAPLFNWQRIVVEHSELSSTELHVCLTLSLYMSALGDSCFPSVRRIASDTRLAESTVRRALNKAIEHGWITRKLHGYRGKAWRRSEYRATIPAAVHRVINRLDQGALTRSAPETKVRSQKAHDSAKVRSQRAHITDQSFNNTERESDTRSRAVEIYEQETELRLHDIGRPLVEKQFSKAHDRELELWRVVVATWVRRKSNVSKIVDLLDAYRKQHAQYSAARAQSSSELRRPTAR